MLTQIKQSLRENPVNWRNVRVNETNNNFLQIDNRAIKISKKLKLIEKRD